MKPKPNWITIAALATLLIFARGEKHSASLGPIPPAVVQFAIQQKPSLGALILDGAESICHTWTGGCSPTASFCWLKYLDDLGFNAIPDDKPESDYIESPEWYETVSLPIDYGPPIPDCTELPDCDPPDPPTSLAGYMRTSASADGLVYGSTWSDKVLPGVVEYLRYVSVTHGLPEYQIDIDTVYSFGWDTVVAELERGYPLPALGYIGGGGHSWVIVGYDDDALLTAICSTWSSRIEWVEYGRTDSDVVFKLLRIYPVALTWDGMPELPGLVPLYGKRVYLPFVAREE